MSHETLNKCADRSKPLIVVGCGATPVCLQLQDFLSPTYDVICTTDCSEVISLTATTIPDLVLMSAENPGCHGLTICAQMQKSLFRSNHSPAVMLFGPEVDELIDQAFDAGADEYIREPIHWKLLHHRIHFLIQKRKSELELHNFADQLEKINAELRDFTYVVSHDLQEPLHLIRAFAERITTKSQSVLDEQGSVYLQRIQKSAGRMQGLIDGLLQYSRLTTQAKDFVTVDLNQVLYDVITDLEIRVDQLGATIKIDDLGSVVADPLQMRQLFQNLISNSLKYSCTYDENTPQIEVFSSRKVDPDGGVTMCEIVVKDNGIGFDSCFQNQIFGLFQRLHGRDEYNGTGIGLAICKKIVERHGGKISACSSAGKGAEFIVVLPVKQSGTSREMNE